MPQDYPATILEFEQRFATEAACRAYLIRVLGLGGYLTAWSWLHKLRRAMVGPGRKQLGGEVEVDETYVGGLAEGPRGRGSQKKALVAIAAEKAGKRIGRIGLTRIADASTRSLRAFVEANLDPGTHVVTDGWEAYAGLPQWGYGHGVHVLRGQGADAVTRLLPRVHRVAALLKRWLLGTPQGAVRAPTWTITSMRSLSDSIGEGPHPAANCFIAWCSRRWRFRLPLTKNFVAVTPSRCGRLSQLASPVSLKASGSGAVRRS